MRTFRLILIFLSFAFLRPADAMDMSDDDLEATMSMMRYLRARRPPSDPSPTETNNNKYEEPSAVQIDNDERVDLYQSSNLIDESKKPVFIVDVTTTHVPTLPVDANNLIKHERPSKSPKADIGEPRSV